MKALLGLNVNSHNTSSAVVVDGKVVFAVEEERLSRVKKTRDFPHLGIKAGLRHAGLGIEDLDAVVVSVNPGIYLEAPNVPQTQRARFKGEILYSVAARMMSMKRPNSVRHASQRIDFLDDSGLRIEYVEHHLAHAASAFYVSPWDEAAVLSVDGFGEKDCVLFARGKGSRIEVLQRQEFPHSLGGFYSTITEFLGFEPNNDEWKVMGASSYGDPAKYYDKLARTIHLLPDGGFELDLTYFTHYQFHRPGQYSPKMIQLLGEPRLSDEEELTQRHYDIAAAAQKLSEETLAHMFRHLHKLTGLPRVCFVGGVAFNSVANGRITADSPFREAFIPPMPDDSGGAVGAPLYLYHHLGGQPRDYVMRSNALGPGYTDAQVEATLKKYRIRHTRLEKPHQTAAELVSKGKIIGFFNGRVEFGDRALGHRSILADPRDAAMKDKVNETIKYREKFRPFAPSILEDHAAEYFADASPTPFMEKVLYFKEAMKARVPAVVHVDGTGRLQTVSREANPRYWQLIDAFRQLTGVPIVLNTSFNLKGEPIVCAPEDAIRTFYTSGLDALVLESFLIEK